MIAIAGGTGSGKTFLVKKLINIYGKDRVFPIHVDSYYKNLSHLNIETRAKTNFDHPSSFEFSLLAKHLIQIRRNINTKIPIYDYTTHTRSNEVKIINNPYKIILLEGIFALYKKEIRKLINYGVFIDVNENLRIERRIKRDMKDRARTYESILIQYNNSVKPMFMKYIKPTKQFADLIIKKPDNSDLDYIKLLSIIDKIIY